MEHTMNILHVARETAMSATALSAALTQELLSGHTLMMQCGASALHILNRARTEGATGFDFRAGYEAVRMADLSARLMHHHTTGVRLLHRLPAGAPAPSA